MRLHRPRPAPDTIETDNNFDVRFWTQQLMVSRATLLRAVGAVGRDVATVRAFLATSESTTRPIHEIRAVPDDGDTAPIASTICNVQYVSRPAPTLQTADLDAILSWSRDYNPAHRITGVLLFTGRHFSQVLEGPPAAVHALMETIRADPRHREVRIVRDVAIARRSFPAWSMAWVQDFGLRALLEELWWVATIDNARAALRAAELVKHLRHAVAAGGVLPLHDSAPNSSAQAPPPRARHDGRTR